MQYANWPFNVNGSVHHFDSATVTTDRVIWRADLPALLNVSTETVRRWINAGKLPKPDVDLTLRSRGWRMSTLRAAGINLP